MGVVAIGGCYLKPSSASSHCRAKAVSGVAYAVNEDENN